LLADVAIKVHLAELYGGAPALEIPYPQWLDEARVREALKDSAKQHL